MSLESLKAAGLQDSAKRVTLDPAPLHFLFSTVNLTRARVHPPVFLQIPWLSGWHSQAQEGESVPKASVPKASQAPMDSRVTSICHCYLFRMYTSWSTPLGDCCRTRKHDKMTEGNRNMWRAQAAPATIDCVTLAKCIGLSGSQVPMCLYLCLDVCVSVCVSLYVVCV